MVVSKGPEWFVKITGFGVSKRRQQDVTTLHTLNRGTLGFAAPEVLERRPDTSYTFAVDMWSLGAVVYRILTHMIAFQDFAELFKFTNGMSAFPMNALEAVSASTEAQDFILKLLKPKPEDRLLAKLATHHSWILLNTQNNSISSGIQSRAQSARSQMPVEVKLTADSMASKDWSVEDGGNSILSVASTCGGSPPIETGIPVSVDTNFVGSNDVAHTVLSFTPKAHETFKYKGTPIDHSPDKKELCPNLPAAEPFVFDNFNATRSEARPAEMNTPVTLETEPITQLELDDDEPATSIFEDAIQHQEDHNDDASSEISRARNELSGSSPHGSAYEDTKAPFHDQIDTRDFGIVLSKMPE
jgi:serine/threonine protein kinase